MKYLFFGLLGLLALAVLGRIVDPGDAQPVTAERLATDMRAQVALPKDMGDGLRLDQIAASGNDIVFTATMTDTAPGQYPAEAVATLEQVSLSDACRNLSATARTLMNKHGIAVVKEFRDAAGGIVIRQRITPAQCQ